ncbi:kinase-like protein [Trematosphaeria pertusa]|uniref:Kinase-like protein n=1 Tax=Trematosphaeria pertusa TaxID=390896 RepID=A0A6A6IVU4_9PLEO|nr:kinase-like protein [Trematosphaeria pertusa]KAF2254197.1 kinase-like protein [Trematosphaeria pertusa]
MSDREVIEYRQYCPPGVRRVLAFGTSAFIGEVDGSTVLKYPLEPGGDMSRLKHEHTILKILGQHPRIVAHKGLTDAGLYLERAANETIYKYLVESDPDRAPPSLQQRVTWCREVAEAVEHVHSKSVIHCDIQPTNILVDENLHLKLADFQGDYLSSGEVIAGWSGEPCRYFCPRDDEFETSPTTDLFALGSTIYFIMTGYEVFQDIAGGEDGWAEQVRSRFASGIFPGDSHACDFITRKCWERRYSSASEVLEDIRAVEKQLSGQHHESRRASSS